MTAALLDELAASARRDALLIGLLKELVAGLQEVRGAMQRIEQMTNALPCKAQPDADRQFFDVPSAARALGLSTWTARNYCRLGRIRAVRATTRRGAEREWRISREEIIHILEHGLRDSPYE